MPMNNWGGITEHMTKKPRKFFGRKKNEGDFSSDKNQLSNSTLVKANQKKRNKIIKELIIFAFIIFFVFLGVFLFSKDFSF